MADIKELQAENENLKTQLAAAQKKINTQEEVIAKASKSGVVSLPVKGTYKTTVKTPAGDEQKLTIAFKDGYTKVRVPKLDGVGAPVGAIVESEVLFNIANGKDLTEDQQNNPVYKNLDKDGAAKILTYFAQIKAACVK